MPDPKPVVHTVKTPSGAQLELQTKEEVTFYRKLVTAYEKDFAFTNTSDILELERLVSLEVTAHRLSLWMNRGKDYDDDPIVPAHINKEIDVTNKSILAVKSALGVDRKTRDKDKGASLSEYLMTLKTAAEEMGVVRNKQAVAAITLWMEMDGMMTFFHNCNEDERTEFHMHEKDILAWIDKQIPEFRKIDAKWRQGSQKYFIRDL